MAPFDAEKLASCAAYIAGALKPKPLPLTQLYLFKFHVLIDLFALQRTGLPIIGGSVAAMKLGPVVREARDTLEVWFNDWHLERCYPPGLRLVAVNSVSKVDFRSNGSIDADDYSPLEVAAMRFAWSEVGHLKYGELDHYTHAPETFMGRAWLAAAARKVGRWTGSRCCASLTLSAARTLRPDGGPGDEFPWRFGLADAGVPDVAVDDLGHATPPSATSGGFNDGSDTRFGTGEVAGMIGGR